jgi:hypothetical protein
MADGEVAPLVYNGRIMALWFFCGMTCVCKNLVLWKNNVLRAQKLLFRMKHARLSYQALRVCCGAGKILASLRGLWAFAARRKTSFVPHWPRNRSRPKPARRLTWAKSISTFFRRLIETLYCLVLAMSRAAGQVNFNAR